MTPSAGAGQLSMRSKRKPPPSPLCPPPSSDDDCTSGCVILRERAGRLGNNLMQLVRALRCAEDTGRRVRLRFPIDEIGLNCTNEVLHLSDASGQSQPSLSFPQERCDDGLDFPDLARAAKLLRSGLRPAIHTWLAVNAAAMREKDSYRVLLHVRGGDVYRDQTLVKYVQPPLAYYLAAISNARADGNEKVLVVSEDMRSPVIKSLKRLAKVAVAVGRPLWQDVAAMLGAEVIVCSISTLKAVTLLRTKPYRQLWSFCHGAYSGGELYCSFSGTEVADVELHVRARHASYLKTQSHEKRVPLAEREERQLNFSAANLLVRSNLHQSWTPLVSPTTRSGGSETAPTSDVSNSSYWSLTSACIAYYQGVRHHEVLLAQGDASQSNNGTAVLWARPWPAYWSEYVSGFKRPAWPDIAAVQQASKQPMEWHHGAVGLVLPLTHVGNLFHVLPHAVPFADAYHALVAANKLSSLHVLPYAEPKFARQWPTVRGEQWGYWQIILGALGVPEGAWSREVANLNAHVSKGGFHCYPTVRGGHAPFLWYKGGERSVLRMRAFRNAVLLSLPSARDDMGGPRMGSVLFSLMHVGTRAIVNEAELVAHLHAHSRLGPLVRFVDMASTRLLTQMQLVQHARVLASVHGHACAWTALLPTTEHTRCALVELFPSLSREGRVRVSDYRLWSIANNVSYFTLDQPSTEPCRYQKHFRDCGNMTVIPSTVARALSEALDRIGL